MYAICKVSDLLGRVYLTENEVYNSLGYQLNRFSKFIKKSIVFGSKQQAQNYANQCNINDFEIVGIQ